MRFWPQAVLSGFLAASSLGQAPTPLPVRRAQPADQRAEPPVARAVPRDPTPTPEPAATPAEGAGDGEIRIAPSAAEGNVSPEEAQFNLANQYYVRKDYTHAAPEYERYLGQYPDGARRQAAFWWLSECYRFLNRPAAARSSLQNLIVSFTEGEFVGPAYYRLASMDFNEKDYRTAVQRFQRSASLAKGDDVRLSSRYFEALCLEFLNRKDETKEVYEEIIGVTENNPYRDDARLALGRLAVSEKHPNEAFKQYEALAREATKPALQAESALKAGLLAHELDQNETALTLLERASDNAAATASIRTDALLARLHLLYDTNKYQAAISVYNGSASALPGSAQAEAILIAASSDRQLGKHADAQALYGRIVSEFPSAPQAPEARYQRIISLYASSDPNFVSQADDFLLSNPEPVKADEVRLMKADTLFKKSDYAGASAAYAALDGALNLPSKYKAEAAYRLGYCYAQLRQPERTVGAFTKFLRYYPDHPFVPKALVQRAVAFQQLRNYTSALADFNAVIDDYHGAKEREIALQQKALILGQQDDSRGMAEAFRALVKDYPKSDSAGQANFYIGRAAFDEKDYAAAIPAFEAARKADPKEYGNRASLMVILCEFQLKDAAKLATEADAYLKAGIQPDIPADVLLWLGADEYEKKDYTAAERHLATAASSKTNKTADTWLTLARTQLLLKKWDDALESSHHYLEMAGADPATHAIGLLLQGEAQLGASKYDDAQKSADQALDLQPEGALNGKARMLGGHVSFSRGDFEAAAKTFMSVAVLYDDPDIAPQALREAAVAFEKAGKPEDAAKATDELKSRFPNFNSAGT